MDSATKKNSNPYAKLKNVRYLETVPREYSIEVDTSLFSVDISPIPSLVKVARGDELPHTIECIFLGNWKTAGAHIVVLTISTATTKLTNRIVPGRKNVFIDEYGIAMFELKFNETSLQHKNSNFNLVFTVYDKIGRILFAKKSPPFHVYSKSSVLKAGANVEIKTVCPTEIPFQIGRELHLIGTPFIEGPNFAILIKIADKYEAVQNYVFYSKTVVYFQMPPCQNNNIEAEIIVTNDGITHSNVKKVYYV